MPFTIVYLHGFRIVAGEHQGHAAARVRRRAAGARATAAARSRTHASARRGDARRLGWVERERGRDALTFIGSSLGGYYATYLAERYGARAVLINPAMRPVRRPAPCRGAQTNMYTGETFEVTQAHFDELRALAVARITRPGAVLPARARPATRSSTGARRSRSTAARSSTCAAAATTRLPDFAAQIPAILRFAGIEDAR